jgi:hypothetical protein
VIGGIVRVLYTSVAAGTDTAIFYGPCGTLYHRVVRRARPKNSSFDALAAEGRPPAEHRFLGTESVSVPVGALLATGVGPQRRSRVGSTRKVPAPTDTSCRPVAFRRPLHGYRVCSTGSLPPKCKGYGSNAIRRNIESKKTYHPRSSIPV